MLGRAQRIVRAVTGCARVYALAFGEATPHMHCHLVPRHAADADTESWRVADVYRAVASGERPAADAASVAAAVAHARALWTAAEAASNSHSAERAGESAE